MTPIYPADTRQCLQVRARAFRRALLKFLMMKRHGGPEGPRSNL